MVTLIAAYLLIVAPVAILASAYRSNDWGEADDFESCSRKDGWDPTQDHNFDFGLHHVHDHQYHSTHASNF
jgi:hypothetical protein